MARTEHYYTKLLPGNYYHIYNRAVNRKKLFTEERNYGFFLSKMIKYIKPYMDIYAYCLLSNHFHLLVKIKDEEIINTLPVDLTYGFRKMFQSYAMAFNIQENRRGTLFQEPFKRAWIDKEDYLYQIIYYIHSNPKKHRIMNDFINYPYRSFCSYSVKIEDDNLAYHKIIDLFGGHSSFLDFHKNQCIDLKPKYLIEK